MGDIVKFKRVPRAKQKPLPAKRSASFGRIVMAAVALSFVGGAGAFYVLGNMDVAAFATSAQAAVTEKLNQVSQPIDVAPVAEFAENRNPSRQISTTFRKCGSSRRTCVVDGDTLWINGSKIRIANIDTPEISQPRCSSEKALGNRATARLIELVNAGPFEMLAFGDRDEDKYGRKLRVLVRGGRDIGDILVTEGLARTWTGRREPWC